MQLKWQEHLFADLLVARKFSGRLMKRLVKVRGQLL
jgi:hypothetical protein